MNAAPLSSDGIKAVGIIFPINIANTTIRPKVIIVCFGDSTKYFVASKYLLRILLNQVLNFFINSNSLSSSCSFKIIAHNAGVNDNATIVDKPIEQAIQTANCWNILPFT